MIRTLTIELHTMNRVKDFVNDVGKMQGEFDLIVGRYVIDAKSIMGIFSLDLSKPLQLRMTDVEECDIKKLNKYCLI